MTHNHDEDTTAVLADLAGVAKDLGDMAGASVEELEAAAEAPPPEPQKFKLDTEDSLRLENLMLRQQTAKMSAQLAEMQAKENQEAFQNHLVKKLGIDTRAFQLQVNPSDHTVTIVPR